MSDLEVAVLNVLNEHAHTHTNGLRCSCGVPGQFGTYYAHRCHVAVEVAKVLDSDDRSAGLDGGA